MRKLLVLVFVAMLCVPSYGSILVYKTSIMDTIFSGGAPTKATEPGYLILNVNLDTQVVSDAQYVAYSNKPTKTQTIVNVTVDFNESDSYIVAEYLNGNTDAVLFGKTTGTSQVAKSLKGSLLVNSESSFSIGSGTISATLDTKKWTGSDVPTVAGNIQASLTAKGYVNTADTTKPTPSTTTFATVPTVVSDTQITMTAITTTDATSPPVEYYFTNVTDSGHNSGWQLSPTFIDTLLTPDTNYTYNVMARDSAAPLANQTTASANATARTNKTADTTPPEPNVMTWAVGPNAISDTAITMTATTAIDAQGPVRYYFTNKQNPTGHNSGWQLSPTFTDTNLTPNTRYDYNVMAKDNALVPNLTARSVDANATTFADTTAPTPNPMTFATVPEANGATAIYMVATTATDSAAVQYSFENVYGAGAGGTSSGWQTSPIYQDTGLDPNKEYGYRVRAKDASGNMTGYSSIFTATTGLTITMRIADAVATRTGTAHVTVTIPSGTYFEDVVITDPCVTLQSASGNTTILTAKTDPGVSIRANYVTIGGSAGHGFTIDSIDAVDQAGVADSVAIVERNVTHTDISYNTIIADGHTHYCLVSAAGAKNILISNNSFTGDGETLASGGFGIMRLNQVNDINVFDNTADGNSSAHVAYGFQVNGCVGPAFFTHNTITDINAGGAAIYVTSGQDGLDGITYTAGLERMTINNNTLSGCKRGILVVNEYSNPGEINNVTITGNTIQNNVTGVDIGYNGGLIGPAAKFILAKFVVTNNSFINNITNQVSNTVTATNLPAAHNWWGNASGPYNATSNSGGLGGSVTDLVVFNPIWTNAAMTTDANVP